MAGSARASTSRPKRGILDPQGKAVQQGSARARLRGGRRRPGRQVRRDARCGTSTRDGRDRARAGDVRATPRQRASSRTTGVEVDEERWLMRWGVVVFPGSNDDRDALRVAERSSATRPSRSGTSDRRPARRATAIVLPGGFSYGDYLRCGAMARVLADHGGGRRARARAAASSLGICNGFQILCEAGLAARRAGREPLAQVRLRDRHRPGRDDGHRVHLRLPRAARCSSLPIKHGEGCYVADEATLAALEDQRSGRLPLRRSQPGASRPRPTRTARSTTSPACATPSGNVVGLMPHPEHAGRAAARRRGRARSSSARSRRGSGATAQRRARADGRPGP